MKVKIACPQYKEGQFCLVKRQYRNADTVKCFYDRDNSIIVLLYDLKPPSARSSSTAHTLGTTPYHVYGVAYGGNLKLVKLTMFGDFAVPREEVERRIFQVKPIHTNRVLTTYHGNIVWDKCTPAKGTPYYECVQTYLFLY